jgi:hypothetical protein
LEDGRPKDGARAIRTGSPERSVGEILDFKDSSKKRVFIGGNVPGSLSDKTFINRIKVSDAYTTILFRLTDILPGAKGNWISGIIVLDASPPESTDNSSDFLYKRFGEKNHRHIIDRN